MYVQFTSCVYGEDDQNLLTIRSPMSDDIEAATGGVLSKNGVLRNFAKFTEKHIKDYFSQNV